MSIEYNIYIDQVSHSSAAVTTVTYECSNVLSGTFTNSKLEIPSTGLTEKLSYGAPVAPTLGSRCSMALTLGYYHKTDSTSLKGNDIY